MVFTFVSIPYWCNYILKRAATLLVRLRFQFHIGAIISGALVMPRLSCTCFNSILVQLYPRLVRAFQRFNGSVSIPYWCNYIRYAEYRYKPSLITFQFHIGAIISRWSWKAVRIELIGFNSILVQLYRLSSTLRTPTLRCFNSILVQLYHAISVFVPRKSVQVSIPYWCNYIKPSALFDCINPFCFNSILVQLYRCALIKTFLY